MIALVVRRLLQSILVMLAVALIGFTLFRYVGDPVAQMVGQETSLQERAELRDKLGLNDPVVIQFASYVGDIAQGRFGFSYAIDRPVSELLLERLPATLELSLIAALYALLIGIPMGVYSALHPTPVSHQSVPDDFTDRYLPAHLSHRYFVDLDFWRLARPAADLWAWRGCRPRLVDHRFADCKWLEIGAHARLHSRDVSTHTDHAPG